MSENKGTGLYAKMARVMSAIEPLAKDGVNSFFNYKFATDRAVYEAVREQLGNEGLAILTSMVDVTQMYDENGGKQKWRTMAKFEFTIADGASGETHTCVWWAEAADQSDKGVNKCATAALKYWLLKTFLIPTGDDPDADAPEKGAKSARRTVNAQTGEVTRSEAQPTTRAQRSTQETGAPHGDELPPAAQEMAHWTTESGAINKMVAWAREQVWDGIELPHARNRVAKALGVTNFASIAAEYRGTKQEAMAAIQAYVPSDEREGAPAEQPQLVEAPVPADTPQKRRKAG